MKSAHKIGIYIALCCMCTTPSFTTEITETTDTTDTSTEKVLEENEPSSTTAQQVAQLVGGAFVMGMSASFVIGTLVLCTKTAKASHPEFNIRRLAASVVFIETAFEAGKYTSTALKSLVRKLRGKKSV